MKILTLMIGLIFFTSINAREVAEQIAITKTDSRSHVNSYLRIDKDEKIFAIIVKKTEIRGLNGCLSHRGSISTNNCRVSTKEVNVSNLSLQGEDIEYDNGQLVVTCGLVRKTWLGSRVVLNSKCTFSQVINNGYTTTQFHVTD